ncbi:hypothetical protein M5K25_014328 [Dendrobium thyrsiflorum]|uniref:Uncharacterized protein n=1 Tax=Dendrobium thyrsiflorum TaxID=117978 RepID=A0ABD0UV68_DENTH
MNCKSYIPGYYTMKGLKDTGNSWPLFYENKLLNGHLHNGCMFSSLNGYSEYDKEMLKRTMLEHEATFRKQVYELHRLYRIQKDLMEEFQKNGLYRFSSWTVKSNTSLSSSEAQSQVTGRMWQIYHQPALSSSQSRETTTVTNTNVSPISTLQSCFGTLENGPTGRDGEANASFRASTNRMFDLQAPADLYIEAVGTERSEKEEITGLPSLTATPYSRKCNGDPENEVKLTLANVSNANGGAYKYESHRKKSLFHCLADLNESIEDTSLVGTAYSFPSPHLGVETQLDDNHRPNGSLRSTNLWLQISSSKNPDFDESCSLPEIKKEPSQVCSHFLGETGKSKFDLNIDSGKEKYSMSFEPIQMSPIKANDILLEDLNKAEALFGQKKANFLEIPREGSDCAVSASLFPTWMKPSGGEKQSSAPLQTISSFDKSTTMDNVMMLDTATEDPSGFCDRFQFCSDLRSSHLENGKFSHPNGFNHGFHQDSHSVSQLSILYGNLDLNLKESCSFDIRSAVTAAKNEATSDTDGDCEELSPELPWLKKKPNCNEFLNLGRLSSGLDLCFSSSSLGNEGEVEIKTPIPSCKLEDLPANMQCIEEKTLRNEVPSCSSREKIIGFPIFDKIQPNLNFLNKKHQQVDELQHDSVFRDINPLNTEKELSAENSKSFRNHIDLNCEVTFIDEPNDSKMSDKSPVGVPSLTSDTLSSSKAFPLIDMDAPAMPLEHNKINEIEATPCSIRNDSQQNGFSNDLLIKEAAENMITLSIDKFKHLDDDQSCLSTEPPCNTLHLFADMALLNAHMINSDLEMDLFELMTLQLEEMKPEEAWCTPQETENAKDDEKSRALLLFKKPRRGQARKRRQRRDFQKDTLPGLATLSRKEMVEDLQLIGGLLKASGCHWELSTGRRNSSRNGTPAKAKRRQAPKKTSIAITEEHSRPQQTLFLFSNNATNLEFEVDRPGMLGWGRTTRRCRRQRSHPPQSVTTALT